MSAWILIPCLVELREEFNAVAPRRDKGSDGSIGDSAHTSSSDHTPDEDSDVLRDHDADSKSEVHAVDIDCTGPWPDGRGGEAGGWFDRTIHAIVDRERAELHSTDVYGRLEYVIWRGRIASRSRDWAWRDYVGPSAHFDHAHFSARYLTRTESDTRPWGVNQEDDVAAASDMIELTKDTAAAIGDGTKYKAGDKLSLATLVQLNLIYASRGNKGTADIKAAIAEQSPDVDEAELAARIVAAIPDGIAEQVAQKLADRLAS